MSSLHVIKNIQVIDIRLLARTAGPLTASIVETALLSKRMNEPWQTKHVEDPEHPDPKPVKETKPSIFKKSTPRRKK
jgi:hypothetical protein